MKRETHGIFCLEGDWWDDFNRTSTVKPVLKLLAQGVGPSVPFVHRDVATLEEFKHYCERWSRKGTGKFPILYLAFHGGPAELFIGRGRRDARVTLDELAEFLGDDLRGRLIHFGSCETLATDRRNIARFLKRTGAVAVTGFKREVDWLYSSVFDVLLFEVLLRFSLTTKGARAAKQRMLGEHGKMCKELQFRMEVRGG